MDIDLRVYEDTYRDLRKKNMTKLSFPSWMDRMLDRNSKLRRKEFEERRIKMSRAGFNRYFGEY